MFEKSECQSGSVCEDQIQSLASEDGDVVEELAGEESLTERQRDVLNAYRQHGSIAKAADALGISTDTAKEHMGKVRRKFGVESVNDLRLTPLTNSQFAETKIHSDVDDSGQDASTKITAVALMRLLEDQRFRCALSGVELTPSTMAADHIVPLSEGGEHCMGNIQLVTDRINVAKGTMPNDEFVAMCRAVAGYWW